MDSKDKKEVSGFVPYRRRADGVLEFYLQKRDGNAPIHANIFSLFGGGLDAGETAEQALKREVLEELSYEIGSAQFFSRFETSRAIFYLYCEAVDDGFEDKVTVLEGEYGKFLTAEQIVEMPNVSPIAKLVIEGLSASQNA